MDLVLIKQLLLVVFGALGIITTVLGLFVSKEKHPKVFKYFAVVCVVIIAAHIWISARVEIVTHNQIFADLVLNIGEPYVVNVDGIDPDRFVKDANYRVVSYNNGTSINATIELINTKTGEKSVYKTVFLGDENRLVNIGSGEYIIRITTDEYLTYEEHIILDSTNINWDGTKNVWDFTAFMFEDFFSQAHSLDVNIRNYEFEVEYPVFMIYNENTCITVPFRSEVDWEKDGLLSGEFWGYNEAYTIGNCVSSDGFVPLGSVLSGN